MNLFFYGDKQKFIEIEKEIIKILILIFTIN